MSCMFIVSGAKFDPDTFLKRSKFKPYSVWHKGDPVLPQTKPDGKKHPSSGFNCEVSRKGFGNVSGQIRDAVRFLTKWRREILKLTRCPEVEDAFLNFGIWKRDVVGQFDHCPAELIQSAGRVGIGITLSAYAAARPLGLKRMSRSKKQWQ
jgi:hypothetical protein